ncbi:MAG TPA: MFS transporter [Puia sp.]|nr:MFS transporter [Puia sp.]
MRQQTENISRYHMLLFAICFLSIAFGGIVSTLMSIYLPAVTKDLQGAGNADIPTIGAYINAAFIFGWAVGGFVWGVVGDRMGRKNAMVFSILCYGEFTCLTGSMHGWLSVVFCRLASGFGMGGVLVASTTIMIEEWPERSKAVFMGILSISMPVGIFSAALIARTGFDWRQAFLIGVAPVILSLLSFWLLKESEKWKRSRGAVHEKEEKAESIFSREYGRDLLIGSVIFGTMLIGLWAIFSWLPTWLQGLMTSGGSDKVGSVMMVFAAGGLTGGFLSGWLLNAIGSRKSMLLCFAACSTCSFLLFKTNSFFSNMVYVEVTGIALFFGASQGVLSVYIPELFPVKIRATATGFCFNIGRLLTATAILFVGLLQSVLGGYGNALFIFSFVFVAGLVATLISTAERKTKIELA